MDPKTLSRSKTLHTNHMILTAFGLIATLANPALSLNTKFEACAPAKCGNGPNISYPFWLSSVQDSFCGFPNFEITCNDEREPVLAISEDDYRIKDIFYTNQSIFVANSPAAYEQSCPALDVHNISLHRTPFSILPGYVNLSLFYNCSTKPSSSLYHMYPIDCLTNSTRFSYASLHKEFYQVHDSSFVMSCQGFVDAPVITSGGVTSVGSLTSMNYTEVLDLGFVLNWTAPNCSTCESSGGRCGFENQTLVCFCHDKTHTVSCHGKNSKTKAIIGVVLGAAGALLLTFLVWIIYQQRKKRKYAPSSYVSRSISSYPSSRSDVEKGSRYMGVHVFTYTELVDATNNFDEKKELGDGGFGTVYYGKLKDGREVAVKRLYENNYRRVEQFMNEVDILTRLHHKNLVILYGCTSRHSRELLLVYEYIENGTVADHLHGVKARPGSLPWPLRLNIAVETARALTYLHASDIIHRDVKTNNILMDKNFCVKVADFGLSRLFPMDVTHVSTAPQGTPGYVDPEYHQCYQLTDKSDVYSFGVVLAELISSLPAVDITRHRHEINLSNMAINKIQSQSLHEFVDQSLGFGSDETVRKSISAVAELAFQCLQSAKELRPTMDEVLETLTMLQTGKRDPDQSPDKDTTSDDVGLLKYGVASPLSPVSVTAKWSSSSGTTTPNTSC